MSKSESEVLIPQYKTVKIAGVTYEVKPFSVKDVVFFTRDLIEGLSTIKQKYPSLEFKQEEVLVYLPILLDEIPRIIGLIARSIGKDQEWLEAQNDLAGVSELFKIVTEINDFGTIISNFKNGWNKLQQQTIRVSAEQ